MDPLKLLICAYACNPAYGSEEAVGWQWIRCLAQDHDVTVVTAAFNRDEIEQAIGSSRHTRFIYVEPRWWDYRPIPIWKRIEASLFKPIMNLAYVLWQRRAARTAHVLMSNEDYDLIHQLTYVGYRFPGRIWKLGLPFVWGPIGGLENTPWNLLPALGFRGGIYYAGRNLINSVQRRFLKSPRQALRAAGPGVIAATSGISRGLRVVYGVESTVISEVIVPEGWIRSASRAREAGQPLRLVWSGLHLPGKALNLLLWALARIPSRVDWTLDILGDGPERMHWQSLAKRIGIAPRCCWHGKLTRPRALEVMSEAHLLVISSLKDLTSTVLLEGLALGLPVVCPDHCGFSDAVTDACGIKVPPTDLETLVSGFSRAIREIEANEPRRKQMSSAASERARDYTWDKRKGQLDRIYRSTIEWHSHRRP